LGIPNLLNIFNEQYYESLDGGILEAFGRLFRNDIHLYVCPNIDQASGELTTVHNLKVQNHLHHLYRHLVENHYIRHLGSIEHNYLWIKPTDVLKKIRHDDASWVEMVPEKVVNIISERALFRNSV